MILNRILCVFCLITPISALSAKFLDVEVSAESAIVINADTGAVLYEKNSQKQQFPASITKMATALYALTVKGDELDTLIAADSESIASVTEAAIRRSGYKLPSYYVEQGSSHIGIKKGEELKFKDLLYGMMLPSANDASNVVATFVGDTIPEFVQELNDYVKTLGCKDTHFCNPHGLHHPEHVTTAKDMAIIAKEALKNPIFREIVSTVRFTRPKTNKQDPTTLVQLNKLLRTGRHYYKKAIGIKTGHTSFALNTFVGAAKDDERTLIVVFLKTKERSDIFSDAIKVFEAAFNESKVEKTLIQPGKQKFVLNHDGAQKPIQTYAEDHIALSYYPSEEPQIKSFLKWDEVKFPVLQGQKIGEVIIQNLSAKKTDHIALYAEEDVPASWTYWLKSFF